MDKSQSYEQFIIEAIQGLPPEVLAEIAHFVYFTRHRLSQPQAFEPESEADWLDLPAISPSVETAPLPEQEDDSWLVLAGAISPEDLQLMEEAIESGCEQVHPDEW